jgi:transposase
VQIVPEQPRLPPPEPDCLIEIDLANGHRVRVDRHVDAEALRRVLSVLAAA